MSTLEGKLVANNMKVGIVVARFNEFITNKLLGGAMDGLLPIPVPAVANIITDHHLKLHITNVDGELVTPTGAAIAAALRTSEQLPEQFVIEKVGIGAGKREYECVGVLRAMMIA